MPSGASRRVIHLRLRVSEERRASFLAFLREAVPFYEEPGGVHIRLLHNLSDPRRFIEVVEYADPEAHAKDEARLLSDERMKEYLDRWRALLEERAEVEEYEDLTDEVTGGGVE